MGEDQETFPAEFEEIAGDDVILPSERQDEDSCHLQVWFAGAICAMETLEDLEPGDVLRSGNAIVDDCVICVDGIPTFLGRCGLRGTKRAAQVLGPIDATNRARFLGNNVRGQLGTAQVTQDDVGRINPGTVISLKDSAESECVLEYLGEALASVGIVVTDRLEFGFRILDLNLTIDDLMLIEVEKHARVIQAVEEQDSNRVFELLADSYPATATDPEGRCALDNAIWLGNAPIVTALINAGSEVYWWSRYLAAQLESDQIIEAVDQFPFLHIVCAFSDEPIDFSVPQRNELIQLQETVPILHANNRPLFAVELSSNNGRVKARILSEVTDDQRSQLQAARTTANVVQGQTVDKKQ